MKVQFLLSSKQILVFSQHFWFGANLAQSYFSFISCGEKDFFKTSYMALHEYGTKTSFGTSSRVHIMKFGTQY